MLSGNVPNRNFNKHFLYKCHCHYLYDIELGIMDFCDFSCLHLHSFKKSAIKKAI